MSHTVAYAKLDKSRWETDDAAIDDLKAYIGDKVWLAARAQADLTKTASEFQSLNMGLAFAGVSGFPVHAFGRRYCLTAYRAWMTDGPDPVETDEQGFKVK